MNVSFEFISQSFNKKYPNCQGKKTELLKPKSISKNLSISFNLSMKRLMIKAYSMTIAVFFIIIDFLDIFLRYATIQ